MEATTKTGEKARTNGTATAAARGPVQERLVELRELAASDPAAAQAQTWAWFGEAGKRIASDRDGAIAELEELFNSGRPSADIDGQTEGILVTFTVQSIFDRGVAALTGAWMPWTGKRFDSQSSTGDNVLARSAKWPAKVLWPRYSAREGEEELTGFDFTTRVEPSAVDPDTEVLVIDYAPVDSNPRLIIKSIRDELVEVVPGTHLGKMLWRRGPYPGEHHTLLAFFALKTPAG